jgi:hypothetical protein
MTYCPDCGTEVDDGTKFCPECGTNISEGAEGEEHDPEEPTGWFGISGRIPGMKPGSKIRNSFLGFIYIILIFAVIGAAFGGGDDPDQNGAGTGGTTTEAPDKLTHEIGETFTVGSGEQKVEYTIESMDTSDSVGSGISEEEADGEFVVIELTMKNAGKETFEVSDRHIKLVDSQGREYEADSDALLAIEDPIVYEQLDPGISKTFTVVFDVPPDQQDRRLMLEPVGILSNADEHYVNLE